MKLFLVLGILLGGSYSFANFTGVWQGEGTVTTADGQETYCDEMILNITHSKNQIEFGTFRYACGELAINFHPPVMSLDKADNARWKDQSVGVISSNAADLFFVLENNGKARYTVRKTSEKEMDYMDEQIGVDANGKEKITTIKAKLIKVK